MGVRARVEGRGGAVLRFEDFGKLLKELKSALKDIITEPVVLLLLLLGVLGLILLYLFF